MTVRVDFNCYGRLDHTAAYADELIGVDGNDPLLALTAYGTERP